MKRLDARGGRSRRDDGTLRRNGHRLLIVLLLLQVVLVIVLFSSSAHQTYRYVLPLMPYLALIVSWAVFEIGRAWSRVLVAGTFLGFRYVA